jgi:hypothetical protein
VVLVIKLTRSALKLVVAGVTVFVILAAVGLFIALDTASSPSEANAAKDVAPTITPADKFALPHSVDTLNSSSLPVDGSADADVDESAVVAGSTQPQSSSQAPASTSQGLGGSMSNSSGSTSSFGNGGSAAGGTNASSPPSSSNSNQTWHEPWDEWVVSGYYEERTIPAVCGQRDVFGSVCNDCGADISGNAFAHIKDSHHSGYHEGVVGSESYIVKPTTTEQFWVDTSHFVHREGYWQ